MPAGRWESRLDVFKFEGATPYLVYAGLLAYLYMQMPSCCYDPISNKTYICFADNTNYLRIGWVKMNGITPVFEMPIVFKSYSVQYYATCFDSLNKKPVMAYPNGSTDARANVMEMNEPLSTRWLGVANTTVADTETVKINPPGSVVTNQSGLLTGLPYALTDSGVLTTASTNCHVGKALSTTTMILERS